MPPTTSARRTPGGPAVVTERRDVNAIRPLEPGDLPAVARIYAGFAGLDAQGAGPGLVDFFRRVLLDHPSADPEVPTLVVDHPRDGVIGFVGSHVRRFAHRGRPVRVGSFGPLVVDPRHRGGGLGAELLRRYADGPQDLTVNDRALDHTQRLWQRMGGLTDVAGSVGWGCIVAPARFAAGGLLRRLAAGRRPGLRMLAPVDAAVSRLVGRPPSEGAVEPLGEAAYVELLDDLDAAFSLRPAYDPAFVSWLFGELAAADVDGALVRGLVRAADGRAAGAYVMYVADQGLAHVMQVAAHRADTGLVLDHLLADAAARGAIEVRGRIEPHLLAHLRTLRCRLVRTEWALLGGRDRELVDAVLGGDALITRMDGEWWMRPGPLPPGAGGA